MTDKITAQIVAKMYGQDERDQTDSVFVLTENVAGLETEVKGAYGDPELAQSAAEGTVESFKQVVDLPNGRKWIAATAGRGNQFGWYEITEHEVQR